MFVFADTILLIVVTFEAHITNLGAVVLALADEMVVIFWAGIFQ